MKQLKRSGIFKATNVTFDPKTLNAYSYDWWRFVALVEGKVIFNDFRYSVTTAKHQRKVAGVMEDLGIKVDITMPLPRGIRNDQTLAEMILEAEEHLCAQILEGEMKREARNARATLRRRTAKLEAYLENEVCFRDYDIVSREDFGNPSKSISSKVAVHQVVDSDSLERDVENALHSFHRDGFGSVVFYV